MRRTLVPLLAVPLLAAALTACGGEEKKAPAGHPFAGTWRSGEGASPGAGGTTLTVDAKGGLRFKSSRECTGTVDGGGPYRFAIDCGENKLTGTSAGPPTSGAFTMTWPDGDTSEFRAAS
ncbi:hypothetical protein [Actinomadura hibisca]|uniref:hypothetical protein n=1 Tax=Actinomadura hibisca TaxID=68565 RepID=UPI000830016A|nr:hypothetical protein [Actinomadura hibisca]